MQMYAAFYNAWPRQDKIAPHKAMNGEMITWREEWEEEYKVNFDSYNAAIEKRLAELGLNPKIKPRLKNIVELIGQQDANKARE